MVPRRLVMASPMVLSLPALVRPSPAKALVKGYKPPSADSHYKFDESSKASPMQYDIEQLMAENDILRRRVSGIEMSNFFMAIQVMLTGVYVAFTRR